MRTIHSSVRLATIAAVLIGGISLAAAQSAGSGTGVGTGPAGTGNAGAGTGRQNSATGAPSGGRPSQAQARRRPMAPATSAPQGGTSIGGGTSQGVERSKQ